MQIKIKTEKKKKKMQWIHFLRIWVQFFETSLPPRLPDGSFSFSSLGSFCSAHLLNVRAAPRVLFPEPQSPALSVGLGLEQAGAFSHTRSVVLPPTGASERPACKSSGPLSGRSVVTQMLPWAATLLKPF